MVPKGYLRPLTAPAASPDVKRVSESPVAPPPPAAPPDAASPDIMRVVTASPDVEQMRTSPAPAPSPRRDASSPDVTQIQEASPRKPPPSPRDAKGRPPPPPKHCRQLSAGSSGSMADSRLSTGSHVTAQFENN